MKSFPKHKRYENEEYKEFIRNLPCCVPGCKKKNDKGQVDPHHTKSVGSGGSDLTCVPLCAMHHEEAHWSQVKFQEKYRVDFKEVQAECLQQFIEEELCPQ